MSNNIIKKTIFAQYINTKYDVRFLWKMMKVYYRSY